MKDKNKEAIKIVEENRLTNIYSPEDKIRMEIDKQIEVDDRGPSDLTRQVEETNKRIKELDNSLSIALELNDTYQRDNKKLNEQLDVKQKVLDRSNRDKENFFNKIAEISEQNTDLKNDNKSLAKQVDDKVEEVKALKMKLELLDNKT